MGNFFITGGCGFLGTNLAEALKAKGHTVIKFDNLSHPSVVKDNVYGDVRYYRDLLPYMPNCDCVIHLAAQISVDKSIENPQETIDVNVNGTLNVLEACRKFGVKCIVASSSEIYGSSLTEFMSESHPLMPQSPYGASKVEADRLAYSYYQTYGMDVTIVRNFNTFGKYQRDDSYGGVIAKFTKAALAGEPLVIFGDGKQERDYMSAEAAISAYEFCINNDLRGKAINFGSGIATQIYDIATEIREYTQSKSPIDLIAGRKGEVQRLCANIAYANILGWQGSKSLFINDLHKYIDWVKNEKN
jgi:dTDP-glucose 4,6-dehydratase